MHVTSPAKKKPEKPQAPPPKPQRKGKPLNVWIETPLRDAIARACAKNRRPLTEEVSIALEKYLTELGLWPPPPAS